LLSGGHEPDPRFTLANERTFLAWIRTSLALLAGGVAVEAFASEIFPLEIRKVLSISLLLLAIFISLSACIRWLSIERAMRHKEPLPFPLLIPILSVGGTLVTLVLIAFVALRH
jgi:putative membrane protein